MSFSDSSVTTSLLTMESSQGLMDLKVLSTEWAQTIGRKSFKLNPKKHRFEVNLNGVKFTPLKTSWTKKEGNVPIPPNTTIYQTSYTNSTDRDAQNNLKVERTSKATFKAVVVKGFTTSTDMALSLDLPGEVSAAAMTFGRTVKLDHCEETVIEQQMTWSVDSMIPVPPRSTTKARVDVKENHWEGNFTTAVKIKGRVVVNVHKVKPPGNLVRTIEGDVAEVFKKHCTSCVTTSGNAIVWNMEGNCSFDFGVELLTFIEHDPGNEVKEKASQRARDVCPSTLYPSLSGLPLYV